MIVTSMIKEQFEKASPKKPPTKPRLDEAANLKERAELLEKEDVLELSVLKSHFSEELDLSGLQISKSLFSGETFLGCDFDGSSFEDTVFEN